MVQYEGLFFSLYILIRAPSLSSPLSPTLTNSSSYCSFPFSLEKGRLSLGTTLAWDNVAPTSAGKEDTTRSDSSQQPLLQERLDAATGPQGGLLICTLSQEKAPWPPRDWSVCRHLICMHPLRRGRCQIRASACAVMLFTTKTHWKRAPS